MTTELQPLLELGRLYVVDGEPALGVGRAVDVNGDQVRLLLYKDGTLLWRPQARLLPCPPGAAVAPDEVTPE